MGLSGAIMLAADDPAALAGFYGAVLEVEPQPGLRNASGWCADGWRQALALTAE